MLIAELKHEWVIFSCQSVQLVSVFSNQSRISPNLIAKFDNVTAMCFPNQCYRCFQQEETFTPFIKPWSPFNLSQFLLLEGFQFRFTSRLFLPSILLLLFTNLCSFQATLIITNPIPVTSTDFFTTGKKNSLLSRAPLPPLLFIPFVNVNLELRRMFFNLIYSFCFVSFWLSSSVSCVGVRCIIKFCWCILSSTVFSLCETVGLFST